MKFLTIASAAAFFPMVGGAATLMSPSLNNGSFEDVSGSSGSTIDTTDQVTFGGDRRARTGAGVITIPGWSLETTTGAFGGVNFSASTQSAEGVNNIVTNSGGVLNGTSSALAINLVADGSRFNYSGSFHRTTGTAGTYSYSLSFSDGTIVDLGTAVALPTGGLVTDSATSPYDVVVSGSYDYTGVGNPTTVAVLFTINGTDGQVVADNFTLEQTAVPEPSTALLAGLGLVGLLRRRR